MGVTDQLVVVARLHAEGALTDEEAAAAKRRVLSAPSEPAIERIEALLVSRRRRVAAVAAVVAVVTAAAALWFAAVEDRALVELLGVRLPDPRPAVERSELRLLAAVRTVLAAGAAAVAVGFFLLWLLARPPAAANHRGQRRAGTRSVGVQPPMYDISTRGSPDVADERSSL